MGKCRYIPFSKQKWFLILFLQVLFTSPSYSQPIVRFNSVISGLSAPVDIVNAGDGTNRVFIAQQGGIIRVYNVLYGSLGNFLTVTGISTGGERGLLSIAFHPSYETNGFFWVYYTNASGDIEIARYQVSASPNVADPATKQVVLTIPHPTNTNHNGGKLNFGTDGYLYFATGDGGGGGDVPNNAQNGNSLLGKMIRIDVSIGGAPYYTIPADNPYILDPAVLDEIYAIGLRNPFRWSFDRSNGDMWISDVGQDQREEINYRAVGTQAGINYGWRCYEGNQAYNLSGCLPIGNYVFPIYDYLNPPASAAAVTGGLVYRGANYPVMQGYHIATDVYSGALYITNTVGLTTTVQPNIVNLVAGFGETEAGELVAVSLNGNAYTLRATTILPIVFRSFTGTEQNGLSLLKWQTSFEQDLRQFEVEYSYDGISFSQAGIVAATNDPNGSPYSFLHQPATLVNKIYYRLKTIDQAGVYSYSGVISIIFNRSDRIFVYPSPIKGNHFTLNSKEPYSIVQIINCTGSLVHREYLDGQTGMVQVRTQHLTPGVYLIQLISKSGSVSQKVIFE